MKKVKFISIVVCFVVILSGISLQAHAALDLLGTDSLGRRLIYDTDLDVTWYDYTSPQNMWQNQMDWAAGLSVNFGGIAYDDWRLPTAVDGVFVYGYDGTTTAGYNITSSEMGHLFYTGLGNVGTLDASGNPTGCGDTGEPDCLTNIGDFQNLQGGWHWSGTEYSAYPGTAWHFDTLNGFQGYGYKDPNYYAIAVMSGKAIVPEPISSTLFIVGGATLGFRRFWKKRK